MDFIFPTGKAEHLLKEEIERIKSEGFFDYKEKSPRFSISEAIESKGLMLGLMVARTKSGEEISFKAFSGVLSKSVIVPGFVPPCFSRKEYEETILEYDDLLHELTDRINRGEKELEEERHKLSLKCLSKLEALYSFSTIKGTRIGFEEMGIRNPSTGTGDCATIRLLSYCFRKGFVPVSLAEMWFGKETQTRRENVLYPPCDEKCKPIIKHLLNIDLLYSDDDIAIINKEAGLLSVPGRGEDKQDCASTRIRTLFPSSPLLPSVHRLDMDTSGILVYAKTEEAKRKLGIQFETRETEKIYVALLRGVLKEDSGDIDLPIRLDVDNRPYQIVDFENGKKALTHFEKVKVEVLNGEKVTRVRFYPHTGRTHQLRVHSASGLKLPIVGDRLYGERKEGERLCLHAESLTFTHPTTGKRVTFSSPAPF
ncbi:MAG: RluA family pseudouridine synthase [Sphaerochaetaceae bacterium]|nr:RluA family pseudouridine synthase [Sphaerochaetaceae bacterium]